MINKWEKFFEFFGLIKDLLKYGELYPDTKSYTVDFWDIDKFESGFGELVLNEPLNSIYTGELAILNLLSADLIDKGVELKLKIIKIPETNKIKISKIRAEHLGKFLAIEGTIRRTTEVRPDLRVAVVKCLRCYAILKVQQESTVYQEPQECPKDQGGCGRTAASTAFKLNKEKSTYVNSQKIEISEIVESSSRKQPETLNISLEGDIAGVLLPADVVVINGIIRSQQRITKFRGKSTIFDIFLEGNSIEMKERGYEEIKISEIEKTRIKALGKNKNIFQILTDAFAPGIYGLLIEKLTLVLQLSGGVTKIMPGGMRVRGDSHVVLVGDPSTAKSQLILASDRLAPISEYVAGKNASGPGLGAGAVKDGGQFGDGRWVLEPGAAVLADQGHLGIDEIDKMSKSALAVLYEIMEQQEIHVAKIVKGNLKARCSVLAGANPKFGRFDEYRPIYEQIKLEPALLSRFDVIFPIKDKVDKDKDTKMAEHILRGHQAGEVEKNIDELGHEHYSKEEYTEKMKLFQKDITSDFMRKYLAYVRRFYFPVMSDKSMEDAKDYYIKLRMKGEAAGTIAITPRQLEGIVRLTEASARLRQSNKVESQDIERVINIFDYYLNKVASDSGILDMDIITTGIATSTRNKMIAIERAIKEIDTGPGAKIEEIIEATKLEPEDVETVLNKMKDKGRLFTPVNNQWKAV